VLPKEIPARAVRDSLAGAARARRRHSWPAPAGSRRADLH